MVIPVGPGVLSLRPPCFQQLRLALSQSATLTSGSARCPRRARHWQRAATLCRQHPVLACRHGRIHRSPSHRKKAPVGCFLSVDPAATYLSMTVRHGRGASGHWPFLPFPAFSSSASLLPPLAALGSAVSPAPCAGLPAWNDRQVLN